ncbi:hypothetical protein CLV84_0491 [Neolewinella xylanilytica]|uniref:Tetratricopeptide repeat protein n=1 Tax=Neolewinella xylanilytica TaxID=1514080 RepID=A0A2S6I7V9_9BACT|nr:hypothetical protein CLV84_0491 [Neolewinella xylanilytica]
MLAEVSLDELLAQLASYPYSTNLRLLVLLKAKQSNHPDFEAHLSAFASSTFDRSQLYHLLTALEQREESSSDVLELIELEELELSPLESSFNEEIPSRLNELPEPQTETNRFPVTEIKPIFLEPFDEEPLFPEVSPGVARTARWVRLAEAYTSLFPSMFKSPRPEDPAHFLTELRYQPQTTLNERLRKLRHLTVHRPDSTKGNGLEDVAVVSETLAALLVRQEQYQSAIQMYRRLTLLYPEKKPIFAGLIKELKEKL